MIIVSNYCKAVFSDNDHLMYRQRAFEKTTFRNFNKKHSYITNSYLTTWPMYICIIMIHKSRRLQSMNEYWCFKQAPASRGCCMGVLQLPRNCSGGGQHTLKYMMNPKRIVNWVEKAVILMWGLFICLSADEQHPAWNNKYNHSRSKFKEEGAPLCLLGPPFGLLSPPVKNRSQDPDFKVLNSKFEYQVTEFMQTRIAWLWNIYFPHTLIHIYLSLLSAKVLIFSFAFVGTLADRSCQGTCQSLWRTDKIHSKICILNPELL